MLSQSLQDQAIRCLKMLKGKRVWKVSFAKDAVEKAKKVQMEQSRIKADAEKDLEQTKTSLAEDEKTLSDFVMDCKRL